MLPTRLRIDADSAHTLLRRIKCPILLVTAHDGLLRQVRSRLWAGISPWNKGVGFLLFVLRWLSAILAPVLAAVGATKQAKATKKLWYGLWHVSDMSARRWNLNHHNRLHHTDVPEGGHHLHLTRPEPVADAVRAFLRRSQRAMQGGAGAEEGEKQT
jgi:pimeloyl-ACP methyl ester carboxylesterase